MMSDSEETKVNNVLKVMDLQFHMKFLRIVRNFIQYHKVIEKLLVTVA